MNYSHMYCSKVVSAYVYKLLHGIMFDLIRIQFNCNAKPVNYTIMLH